MRCLPMPLHLSQGTELTKNPDGYRGSVYMSKVQQFQMLQRTQLFMSDVMIDFMVFFMVDFMLRHSHQTNEKPEFDLLDLHVNVLCRWSYLVCVHVNSTPAGLPHQIKPWMDKPGNLFLTGASWASFYGPYVGLRRSIRQLLWVSHRGLYESRHQQWHQRWIGHIT